MTDKRHKEEKKLEKELQELNAQVEKLQVDNQDLLTRLQRISADYANFQKRSVRQISEAVSYEKEKIIKSLLPVMDNFEHTLAHFESAENIEDVVKGVKIIYDQMLAILKSLDVEQITALGEKFDPEIHQAMLQQSDEDEEDGVVLEEFQKGYKLGGRVIRPARVVVNKLAAEEEEIPESQDEEETEADDNYQ
ncbi:MAG: nucleotide exchange factor GrpE [Phycisphaerae bacterium]|jgi:molecular chaperone GrpE